MIRLPKYGKNIRRYADAAFDSAWREVDAIGILGVRKYVHESNPECAVPFDVQLKFGTSGLIGATVTRLTLVPESGFRLVASHIYPLRPSDSQRRRWHAEIYRAVAMRYVVERYSLATDRRPLYRLTDEEVGVLAQIPVEFDGDLIKGVEQRCHQFVALRELEHRAREGNHAKFERLAAQRENA